MIDEKPKLPSPWERLSRTRAQLAAEQGVSVRTLQRQFAAGRECERRRVIEDAGRGWQDKPPPERPYVEIVSGPSERRYHYRLDNDQASRLPLGLFRINDGRGHLKVEHFNNGPRQAAKKKTPKFQPKRPKRKRPPPPAA